MSVRPIRVTASPSESLVELNPLLAGLQLATTYAEMFPLIARDPFRNQNWRKDNQDIDLFRSYMQQVVIPTKSAIQVGLAIHQALKVSLHQHGSELLNNPGQYYLPGSSLVRQEFFRGVHDGMSLLGITGLGKSHLIQASLTTIPQCIERYNIAGLKRIVQINWLYLDLTSIASLEAFASRLVEAVDCALKCNGKLFDLTFKGVRSASAMMTAAVRLLKTHFCGIIVIDEIQFGNFAVGSAAALRDWMLKIANVGIGLVFSGNPLGFRLEITRSKNDKKQNNDKFYATQVMRRLFATNKIRLDPALSSKDSEWVAFTTGIRRCRLYGLAAHPLDLELEELKFKLTAGFYDFYVELHCSLEKILVNNPTQVVDAKLIELAARKSTKITEMQPLILAIYDNNPISLRCCRDVDCDYYEELWKGVRQAQTSTAQVGPVGVVVMPPSTANPEKSLAQDKNLAEKRKATKQAKASKELNPAAAAVRDFHIDKLGEMISGKAVDSESGN